MPLLHSALASSREVGFANRETEKKTVPGWLRRRLVQLGDEPPSPGPRRTVEVEAFWAEKCLDAITFARFLGKNT